MAKIGRLLDWLIPISLPFLLGFINILLLVSPAFLRWEYAKPNFPPERYGWTQEERLELAIPAVKFLASFERPEQAIRLLEEQRYAGEPIYNQRELDHMIDTKRRTDIIRLVAVVTGVVVVGGSLLLLLKPAASGANAVWRNFWNGAQVTAVLLAVISAFILFAWDYFFTTFHELLFPPGTWTFAYSDTLIRLFPEKLWFDVGVLLGVGTLVEALIVGALSYVKLRRGR